MNISIKAHLIFILLVLTVGNLALNNSFSHNMIFRSSNGECKPIFYIYISRTFQLYKIGPKWTSFIIFTFVPKIQDIPRLQFQKCNFAFKNVWNTSFALSCTCENVCKSLNIFSTCILSHALDLDCEPKVKHATSIHAFPYTHNSTRHTNHNYMIHCIHNQLGQRIFVKVHNDKTTFIGCSRVLG